MPRKNELYLKLKKLTGFNYQDIANKFKVSKQHIHSSFSNQSMTYKNSNKFMTLHMINLKIKELEEEISKLVEFQSEIFNNET